MSITQQGLKDLILSILALAALVWGLSISAANAQTFSGNISGEETWSGVVSLSGDVTITETGKLTVLPGTRIECEPKFDARVGGVNSSRIEILVDGGILTAVGEADNPIVFTSADDEPEDDDWYGVRIKSDRVALRHCVVEYADYGLAIEQNGLPQVDHCVFRYNMLDGIRVDTPDTYRFEFCDISNNSRNGVYSTKGSSITLVDCSIDGNGGNGYFVNGETVIQRCEIVENQGYGARISQQDSTHIISDTLVSRNLETGLYTEKGVAFIVSGCTVTQNGENNTRTAADGIYGKEPLNVSKCLITNNSGAGISLSKIGEDGITKNTITDNKYGIQFNSKETLITLSGGNDIYNNSDYELYNQGSAAVVCGRNYLGELTTGELKAGNRNPAKIYDSRDDRTVGEIRIAESLSNPAPVSPIPMAFSFNPAIPSHITMVASRVISGEVTWSGTVLMLGDVTVTETGVLTIQPGTKIECDPRFDDQASGNHPSRIELLVDGGVLTAVGTVSNPIVFTSGDEFPDKNDWYGVRIKSDTVTMRYCTIEYGDIGLSIEQNGKPTVERCVFSENKFNGIKVETPDSYQFDACTISNNGEYGVLSKNKAKISLVGCSIDNNGKDGVYIDGEVLIDGCAITNNQGYGANISGQGSTHTVRDTSISGNKTTGVYTGNGTVFNIVRCVISKNGTPGEKTGADGVFGKQPINVTDCTIRENSGAGISFVSPGAEGIARNTISANKYGIQFNAKAGVIAISGRNDIYNNVEYELINQEAGAAVVYDNYLGELTSGELEQGVRNLTKIFDSRDNREVGEINIPTYLNVSMNQIPAPSPFNFHLDVSDEVTMVVSGLITNEKTWSGTVMMLGDVTVTETGILTIQPGTVVMCDPQFDNKSSGYHPSRTELIIDGGVLNAVGENFETIRFTSAAAEPVAGDWFGLRIASDKVTMRYCDIEYGYIGLLIEQNGLPVVEKTTIRGNLSNGIQIDTPDAYRFDACSIFGNGGIGVYTESKAAVTLTDCSIHSNGGHGVYTDGLTLADGCTIVGNLGNGAYLDGADYSHRFTDCKIGNNIDTGLYANKGIGVTLTNCEVYRNGTGNTKKTADGAYGKIPISLTNCEITENTGAGISFDRIGAEGITGNIVSGNKFGIQFNSKESVLELTGGNDVFNNTDYELMNQGTAAIVADGNYLGELTTNELKQGKVNLTKIYDSRDKSTVGAINIRVWEETPLQWNPPAATPTPTPQPENTPGVPTPTMTPQPEATPTPTLTPTPDGPVYVKGDVDQDRRISPRDAQTAFDLYLSSVKGDIASHLPFTPGTAVWAADMSDDERLTPGDIQAVFDKHIQTIEEQSAVSVTTAAMTIPAQPDIDQFVKVGSAQGVSGGIVRVPIAVTGGENIQAFSMALRYDSSQLSFHGLDRSGGAIESFSTVTAVIMPDKTYISGFAGAAEPVSGDTVLFHALFKINTNASGMFVISPCDLVDDFDGALGVEGDIIVDGPDGGDGVLLIVDNVSAHTGDQIVIPVEAQGIDTLRSFSFDIATDYTFLRFSHIENEDTLTERYASLLGIENVDGGITVAGFSGNGDVVRQDGVLLNLVFDITQSDTNSASISLENLTDDLESAIVSPGTISVYTQVNDWIFY